MDERAADSSIINHFTMFQSAAGFMQQTELKNFIPRVNIINPGDQTTTIDHIELFCLNYQDDQCNHFTHDYSCMESPPIYSYGQSNAGHINIIGDYDNLLDPNNNSLTSTTMIWNQEEEVSNRVFGEDDEAVTGDNRDDITPNKRSGDPAAAKGDRTKSLISERKRRSGMKENLYALRSLVPNITKMDKASIVGDAARYIQDLQRQARSLKTEIATFEAAQNPYYFPSPNANKIHLSRSLQIRKKISKMDLYKVEEKGYYVRLVCNKGRGVGVSLHRALESITSFQVQSSSLATVGDNFVLTFTLNNVTVSGGFDMNLLNLKLWLSGAFLNQGFEFDTIPDGINPSKE